MRHCTAHLLIDMNAGGALQRATVKRLSPSSKCVHRPVLPRRTAFNPISAVNESLDFSAGGSGVRIECLRSVSAFNNVAQALSIASILGSAFWEDKRGSLSDVEPRWMDTLQDSVGQRLYGIQLTLQLLWMHIVWQDSTITLLAVVDPPEPGGAPQVVGTTVVQLKITGKELADACSCEPRAPVIIVSNVAVDARFRGQGVGRALLTAAEEVAFQTYCEPAQEAALAAQQLIQEAAEVAAGNFSILTDLEPAQSDGFSEAEAARISSGAAASNSDTAAASKVNGKGSKLSVSGGTWGAWWQTSAPVFCALIVYRSNTTAKRLYGSRGWVEVPGWVDKQWLIDAEKGRPSGKPRRLLYIKTLEGITPPEVLERLAQGKPSMLVAPNPFDSRTAPAAPDEQPSV